MKFWPLPATANMPVGGEGPLGFGTPPELHHFNDRKSVEEREDHDALVQEEG
jgi:hypothetical protein